MKTNKYKLAIIGGGAAGLVAAISAGKNFPGKEIIIIEKNQQLGRKIYATGNGRCNFSNVYCKWDDYSKDGAKLVKLIFDTFGPKQTLDLFEQIGLYAREDEEGRLYPYSNQGSSVVEVMEEEIKQKGIQISLDNEVKSIKKEKDLFVIETLKGRIPSHKLVISTGGKAGIRFGSNGDGYGFAREFGHTLISPRPALVHIITKEKIGENLKGVRAKGLVRLIKNKETAAKEKGEIHFAEKTLSGICIFELSRYIESPQEGYKVVVDLFPDHNDKEVLDMLFRQKQYLVNSKADSLLKSLLHDDLAKAYLKAANISLDERIDKIKEEKIKSLAILLKGRNFGVEATKGWVEAQVTKGGINTDEVDSNTLESKLCPGLFMSGELLDVDGPCGGWNLQWAFSSGYVAGKLGL